MCSRQELWLPSDFEKLAEKVKPVLPHSVYFKAGIIGLLHFYCRKSAQCNLTAALCNSVKGSGNAV